NARRGSFLHAVSSDGMFHTMYVSNGEEADPATSFLPPNANATGLIVVDGAAYAATVDGCGGAPHALWALDLSGTQMATFRVTAGGVAGSAGPAFDGEGTVYITTTSGDLVALAPKTLTVKEVFQAGQEFTSSPVLFQYKDKTLAAAATIDGRIHLV